MGSTLRPGPPPASSCSVAPGSAISVPTPETPPVSSNVPPFAVMVPTSLTVTVPKPLMSPEPSMVIGSVFRVAPVSWS